MHLTSIYFYPALVPSTSLHMSWSPDFFFLLFHLRFWQLAICSVPTNIKVCFIFLIQGIWHMFSGAGSNLAFVFEKCLELCLSCSIVCGGAKLLQLCPTLFNPMDCSPPDFSVHGILHVRILEWVAMPPTGDLPHPGMEHASFTSPALAGMFFTTCET